MEKIETSKELRDRIVRDKTLQRDLSEKVAEILKGRIKIGEEETYTFVPFIHEKPIFAPEVLAGPANVVASHISAIDSKYNYKWWPWWIGLPAPEFLHILEKLRVRDDPTPEPANMPLGGQILRNKDILRELTEGVSEVLNEHGVVISEDAMYVFSPMVYKKPIFAHELFARPTPEPSLEAATRLLAVESASMWRNIGPIDGIPAPEIFYALEKLGSRIR